MINKSTPLVELKDISISFGGRGSNGILKNPPS